MNLDYRYIKNVLLLNLNHDEGSLKDPDLQSLFSTVSGVLKEDVDEIILNINKCNYLNSYGLGELISIRNYFSDLHINCGIITDNPKIIRLLDMVGISDLFRIVQNESEI